MSILDQGQHSSICVGAAAVHLYQPFTGADIAMNIATGRTVRPTFGCQPNFCQRLFIETESEIRKYIELLKMH